MTSDLPIKVGLEIHQQLATHKLFCNCESRLVDGVTGEFLRFLRPTQSELGEVDRAALEEAKKGRAFRYQATETSCLVEADEDIALAEGVMGHDNPLVRLFLNGDLYLVPDVRLRSL